MHILRVIQHYIQTLIKFFTELEKEREYIRWLLCPSQALYSPLLQ